MKHYLLGFATILLSLLNIGSANAGRVERSKIDMVAKNWYCHYAPESKKQAVITKSIPYKYNGRECFRIVSFDKGGFVLVSANDAVMPVLGYAFDFQVPDSITNEAVKGWFDGYARQIDTAFVLNLQNNIFSLKWDEILQNSFPKSPLTTVGPLLTTTWDQGCYYNELCPANAGGVCGHTWVGCTATAMAQILKYWNYPEGGKGYNSYIPRYNPQYGPQSVFFNETDYNWAGMPDVLTNSNNSVATLMYHSGVSANMDYNTSASGAYLYRAANGFRNNFDYSDSLTQMYRSSVTDSLWSITIKQNLNIGRPVLMEGYTNNGNQGHAWVCDGYQSDTYYHMNWGWSGSANGFYLLNNLNPGGYNFNNSQSVLINIVPNFSSLDAGFYTITNSLPLTLQFVDDSKGNPGSFQWQFGDSTVSMVQNPIHTFPDSGTYQVCLIVLKGSGSDTIRKLVRVWKDHFILTTQSMIGNDGKILAVDYNRDGYQDIINTGYMGHRCYQNNAGTIQYVAMDFPTQSMSPNYLHAADIDNDGDPDLILDGQHPMNGYLHFLYYLRNDSLGYIIDTLENIPLFTNNPFSFADYNGDGKVDLLLGNCLYRNIGNKKFCFQGLIGNEAGISAWEDYDLDGDLDVAIGSRIFNNQGNGVFTDVGFGFATGNAYTWRHYNYEWGDYNQDGKPDLLVGGSIIKNLGNNTFEQIFPDNTAGTYKYSVWGDIDNDGDLDIISMSSGVGLGYLIFSTNIFINNNGSFQLSNSDLQGIFEMGSIDWIDYDHDSKIDLLLEGYFPSDSTGQGNNWTSQLYKNFTDSINHPPSVPGGLSTVSTGNNVILSWNASSDDKTYSGSLTYNLRIGTTLHGNEILSSLSDPVTGVRYVMERGNTGQSTSWKINHLINGKYYWSVQALDNSYAPSAFAPVDSFYVAGNNLPPEMFEMSQKVFLNTPSHISLPTLLKAYYDPEGDSLKAIRINSLPVYGSLEYNGSAVVINQVIPIASLEHLHYFTSVLNGDEIFISPFDGTNWGVSNAKISLVVSPFEKRYIISTQQQSAFAWGDYDNDGDLDLASATKIFKNNNGVFQEMGTALSGSGKVLWGDIDSDGDLDLIIGEKVYKNNGNDQFVCSQTLNPELADEAASFGDLYTQNTLDYLHSGSENSGDLVTKIYLNSGQGVFSDTTLNLLGFRSGAVAWGDFDNDGDQDLAICGIYNGSNQRKTVIYRNDNGQFTDIQANLPGVNVGTLDWGDYDRDGDLDLLLCGSTGTISTLITKVYRNDGGNFNEAASFPGVAQGFAKWIDVNADGFPDVILGGFMDYPGRAVILFININGQYFAEIPGADLPDLAYVSFAAGDYNNDGYPDFILSGLTETNAEFTAIYRNCFGSDTVMVNTPPSVPTSLHTIQTPAGMILQWDKSVDSSTPQNTLSYNILVSRYPDSLFVASPMADPENGFRKIPRQGNTCLNNFWRIDSLALGRYYWTVQAIDNSFSASHFAALDSFDIHPPVQLSGHIVYNNTSESKLQWVEISLINGQTTMGALYTDTAGSYNFNQVYPGIYRVTCNSWSLWNGVNGTDALKIQRHFAGIELLTEPVRLQAADVNNSNSINGTDALKVKRRFAGIDTAFARGNWTFAKPITGGDSIIVIGSNISQDFYGLCVGDVNGSNVPIPGMKSSSGVLMSYSDTIFVQPEQEFDLPVWVDKDLSLSAVSLVIELPSEKIQVLDVKMNSGTVIYHMFGNSLRMAWSEIEPLELSQGGEMLWVRMKIIRSQIENEIIQAHITNECELADVDANVLRGVTLKTKTIKLLASSHPASEVSNSTLTIIPNPNTGQFRVQIAQTISGTFDLILVDTKGTQIRALNNIQINAGLSSPIDFKGIPAGVYYLKLKNETSECDGKIIFTNQ
ncbi:MAG: C10 family peptidase [Bacteroidota bacterium]